MTFDKKPEYHQSSVALYLKCGLQYEYRYVQGIRTPPKAALTIGSAVDVGVSYNLEQKITSGVDLKESDVLDIYSTDFDRRAPETEWNSDENPGDQKDMGAELISLHHKVIAPQIIPATVQESFVIEGDEYNLGGVIDLVQTNGVVVDTKTSKRKYAEDAIGRALQPAMYDLAYEHIRSVKAKSFRYDVLVKPTKRNAPQVQQIETEVTADDRAWLLGTVKSVHKAISAGVAMPAADGAWWCSKDWCGFSSRCPKFQSTNKKGSVR